MMGALMSTGESHVILAQTEVGRRARSRVSVRVIGLHSLGWVEVFEGWGAEIEAMVVRSPDYYKDIRQLVSTTPITAPYLGHDLPLLDLGMVVWLLIFLILKMPC